MAGCIRSMEVQRFSKLSAVILGAVNTAVWHSRRLHPAEQPAPLRQPAAHTMQTQIKAAKA